VTDSFIINNGKEGPPSSSSESDLEGINPLYDSSYNNIS